MSRFAILVLLGLPGVAAGDGPEARARAALAFVTSVNESCGTCRDDLDACRVEARRSGKPIVIFVGGCEARGQLVQDIGAIPCRAASYDRDSPADPFGKRIVVLTPRGNDLVITSLSASATPDQIRTAVAPTGRPLSVIPGPCPTGQCRTVVP